MEKNLAKSLINECRSMKIKILTAESCTGGLVSANLTSIAGCSDVFQHSIVCYSNQSKVKFLNVKKSTIKKWGAVSEQTVKEMLLGLKDQCSEKSFGIAISGVAGPQGSEKKPVGNVFVGIIGEFCELFSVREFNFGELDRTEIQKKAVIEAFSLCLQHIQMIK